MTMEWMGRVSKQLNRLLYRKAASRPAPPGVSFHSRFGGLWVDRNDAPEVLQAKAARGDVSPALRDKLDFFIRNGYVILEQAVSRDAIDAYLAEFDQAALDSAELRASVPVFGPGDKDVVPLQDADLKAPLTKVLDTYHYLPTARELIFAEPVRQFLVAVFEENLLAFQSLHFEKGSTQSIHQDTAYVVLEEPMKLCASWVALQDVSAGSGELVYYPGSHRLPDYIYGEGRKHYNHQRDPHEQHMRHLASLHEGSQATGLELQAFLPMKGDVLIWAADLAHGGAPIANAQLTRRSLVTHYTAASVAPHYLRYKPPFRRKPRRVKPGCRCISLYY